MQDNFIWYERWRPETLQEMTLSPENMTDFKAFVTNKNIPHLLLSGGPGSGKTTIADILIKELDAVALRLNASSADRGIDVIRTKVTQFARAKKTQLKIVFLDEADGLTRDAQKALLNTMEKFSANCRFILTCNYIERIDGAVKSRCKKYSFDQFSKDRLLQLVGRILVKEKYKAPKAGVEKIIDAFYPDIRSCINELQTACSGKKFSLKGIKALAVDKKLLMRTIKAGRVFEVREMLMDQRDYTWVYKFLVDEYLPSLKTDEQKALVVQSIAYWMNKSTTTPIQDVNFTGCLCDIYEHVEIHPKF